MKLNFLAARGEFFAKSFFTSTAVSTILGWLGFIIYEVNKAYENLGYQPDIFAYSKGESNRWDIDVYFFGFDIRYILDTFIYKNTDIFLGIFAVTVVVSLIFSYFYTKLEVSQTHRRGSELLNETEIIKTIKNLTLKKKNYKHKLTLLPKSIRDLKFRFAIGKVPFPVAHENSHILIFGSTGSGKTTAIMQIVLGSSFFRKRLTDFGSLFKADEGLLFLVTGLFNFICLGGYIYYGFFYGFSYFLPIALIMNIALIPLTLIKKESFPGIKDDGGIIVDVSDLLPKLGPHLPHIIVDPFDERSVLIDLAGDVMKDDGTLDGFVDGVFSADQTAEKFWNEKSKMLLEACFRVSKWYAADQGKEKATPADFKHVALEIANPENFDEFYAYAERDESIKLCLKGMTDKNGKLNNTGNSNFATFSTEIRKLCSNLFTRELKAGEDTFSFHRYLEYLKNPKIKKKKWLFIRLRDKNKNLMQTVYAGLLNMINREIVSFSEKCEWPRINLINDEWSSGLRLDSQETTLAKARKEGFTHICATQNPQMMYEKYGDKVTEAIFDHFNTKIIFRLNGKESSKYASELISKSETDQTNYSIGMRENNMQSNITNQVSTKEIQTVYDSQLQNMDDLQCYAKILNNPWFFSRLSRQNYPVEREIKDFIPSNITTDTFRVDSGLISDSDPLAAEKMETDPDSNKALDKTTEPEAPKDRSSLENQLIRPTFPGKNLNKKVKIISESPEKKPKKDPHKEKRLTAKNIKNSLKKTPVNLDDLSNRLLQELKK